MTQTMDKPANEATKTTGRALVTGASAGIGEAFARQLAKRGYDLVLVARRRDRLEKLAQALTSANGVAVNVIDADLSKPEGVAAIEARLAAGDIDLLVNNAGFATQGEFSALPLDREVEELDVNIRALVRLTHAALEPMVGHQRGHIINVGSTGSFQPVPYMSTYAATKAFVLHFSEGVHEEVKQHGVTVTCLCPGFVLSEFQQVAGLNTSRMPNRGRKTPEQVAEAALNATLAGRAIVVPGLSNRLMVSSLVRLTPRFAIRRIAGSMFKDMGTGDRDAKSKGGTGVHSA